MQNAVYSLCDLPPEVVERTMLFAGVKVAAKVAASSRWLHDLYLGSVALSLAALEYRTGLRVINTKDGARDQLLRIKTLADAEALCRWREERVIELDAPTTRYFECRGTVICVSGEPGRSVVHVEQLGCPLRNIPARSWRWDLPSHIGGEHRLEHALMDPGASTVLFVVTGESEDGTEYMSFSLRDTETGDIPAGFGGMEDLRMLNHMPENGEPRECYCVRGNYMLVISLCLDMDGEARRWYSKIWVYDMKKNEMALEDNEGSSRCACFLDDSHLVLVVRRESELGERMVLRLANLDQRTIVCDFELPFESMSLAGPVPGGPYALVGAMCGDRNTEWKRAQVGDCIVRDEKAYFRMPFDVAADGNAAPDDLDLEYGDVEMWIDMSLFDAFVGLAQGGGEHRRPIAWPDWSRPNAVCLREGLYQTPGAMSTTTHAMGGGWFMSRVDVHPQRRRYCDEVREEHHWSLVVVDKTYYVEGNEAYESFNALAESKGVAFDSSVNTYSFSLNPRKGRGHAWAGDSVLGFRFSAMGLEETTVPPGMFDRIIVYQLGEEGT